MCDLRWKYISGLIFEFYIKKFFVIEVVDNTCLPVSKSLRLFLPPKTAICMSRIDLSFDAMRRSSKYNI